MPPGAPRWQPRLAPGSSRAPRARRERHSTAPLGLGSRRRMGRGGDRQGASTCRLAAKIVQEALHRREQTATVRYPTEVSVLVAGR